MLKVPLSSAEFRLQATTTIFKMTAEEYLNTFEPGVIDLMLDPEKSLAEDTERAHVIADSVGLAMNKQGLYHRLIWEVVYPA